MTVSFKTISSQRAAFSRCVGTLQEALDKTFRKALSVHVPGMDTCITEAQGIAKTQTSHRAIRLQELNRLKALAAVAMWDTEPLDQLIEKWCEFKDHEKTGDSGTLGSEEFRRWRVCYSSSCVLVQHDVRLTWSQPAPRTITTLTMKRRALGMLPTRPMTMSSPRR